MKLVLATNNMGKVREFARILEPLGISLLTQQQAGVQVQPEENGTTFAENARIKAMAVYQATGLPTIADDSGLCIDALDGQPGVYSARYYGEDTPYTEKKPLHPFAAGKAAAGKTHRPLCGTHHLCAFSRADSRLRRGL